MVWSVLTLTWLQCLEGERFQHPAAGGGCCGWVLRVLVCGSPAAPAAVSVLWSQQCPAGHALLHIDVQKKGSIRAVLPSGCIQRSAGHAWETSLFSAGRAASRARTLLLKNCDFSSLQPAKREKPLDQCLREEVKARKCILAILLDGNKRRPLHQILARLFREYV